MVLHRDAERACEAKLSTALYVWLSCKARDDGRGSGGQCHNATVPSGLWPVSSHESPVSSRHSFLSRTDLPNTPVNPTIRRLYELEALLLRRRLMLDV